MNGSVKPQPEGFFCFLAQGRCAQIIHELRDHFSEHVVGWNERILVIRSEGKAIRSAGFVRRCFEEAFFWVSACHHGCAMGSMSPLERKEAGNQLFEEWERWERVALDPSETSGPGNAQNFSPKSSVKGFGYVIMCLFCMLLCFNVVKWGCLGMKF